MWAPQVFHAAFQPAATLDLGFVTTGVTNLPTSMGTVLCDLGTDTFLFPNAPGQPFSNPIPNDCTLAGVPMFAQVASVTGNEQRQTHQWAGHRDRYPLIHSIGRMPDYRWPTGWPVEWPVGSALARHADDVQARAALAVSGIATGLRHPLTRVILTGDLNDLLTDSPSNNVFQSFLSAPSDYSFADLPIAQGSPSDWSFPNWPSHLDHILITDELFDEFASTGGAVETIHPEDFLPGGWPQYDSILSDHRPVGIRIPVGDTGPTCPEQIASSELARFGVPPNPLAFIPTPGAPPVVGQVWAPEVFHAVFQPSATLDLAFVTTGVTNLPTSMGTVLCDLGTDTFLFPNAPGQPFSIPIPDDCTLAGVPLFAQVASIAGDNVLLTNGLDIVIGTP